MLGSIMLTHTINYLERPAARFREPIASRGHGRVKEWELACDYVTDMLLTPGRHVRTQQPGRLELTTPNFVYQRSVSK